MADADRTRSLVELQGYCGLTDRAVTELEPWLRVAPAICAGWAVVATLQGAPAALGLLALVTACGAVLPWHPFDAPYNLVVRRWTGTPAIPPSGTPRRLAAAVDTAWLALTAAALLAGSPRAGLILGLAFTAASMVPVMAGVSLVAWALAQARRWAAGPVHVTDQR